MYAIEAEGKRMTAKERTFEAINTGYDPKKRRPSF